MFSPVPTWKFGLQEDLDPHEVYEPFQQLLGGYLPMSQQELASAIQKDRTTVSKWKKGELVATLDQQKAVTEAVRTRLEAIRRKVDEVAELTSALEAVEEAHEAHSQKLDRETLADLEEANDRVREILGLARREGDQSG